MFTGRELEALKRLDEGLMRSPLSERELSEAEARDAAIRGEALDAKERALRPGQGLLTLPDGAIERARSARFSTTEAAAHACGISAKLMWHLECGGVTAPELARRVGHVLGLSGAEVRSITCAKTVVRRKRETEARRAEADGGSRRT
jgi:hypothetical protein